MSDSFVELSQTPSTAPNWWKADTLSAMVVCGVGMVLFAVHYRWEIEEALWLSFAAYLLGAALLLRATRRWNGQRVEASSLARLAKRMPGAWLLMRNVEVPGLGDCDGVVAIDTTTYCIEIKSTRSVVYRNVLFGREKLTDRAGRDIPRDPVAQIKAVSKKLEGRPVLWFPRAHPQSEVRMRCGVLLVLGNEKHLIRALTRWHARR